MPPSNLISCIVNVLKILFFCGSTYFVYIFHDKTPVPVIMEHNDTVT